MKEKTKKSFLALILLAVSCLAGMTCFAFTSTDKLRRSLESDLAGFLPEISLQGAAKLNDRINADLKILESIATYMDKDHGFSVSNIIMNLEAELKINRQFERMGVILPDGTAYTMPYNYANLSGREYFQKAMMGIPNISVTVTDIFEGKEVNVYGVPIRDNDKVVGVLFAGINKNVFRDILTSPSFNGQSFSFVVTSRGDIVVSTLTARRNVDMRNILAMDFECMADKTKILADLQNGRASMVSCFDKDEEIFLSYAPIGINDWHIVSAVPAAAVTWQSKNVVRGTVYIWAAIIGFFTILLLAVVLLHRQYIKKYKHIAYIDELTGIYNWKKFRQDVKYLLKDSHYVNYAFVALDVDKFKSIKDLYGDDYADEILKKMALAIKRHIGKYELYARYMEDNFVILMRYRNEDDIIVRVGDIIAEINGGRSEPLPISAGAYRIGDIDITPAVMHDYAKMAKARIKSSYDKVCGFFDTEMRDMVIMETTLEGVMAESLAKEHFVVYYQPKYRLSDRRITGAEALIRWQHPELGFLSPGAFIPVFEKNGFITSLDLYVFENVCRLLRQWAEQGIPLKTISINLSRQHLRNLEIVDKLKAFVDEYQVSPSLIEVEFTENAMIEYNPVLGEILARFHEIGFTVAMDDFGKGYSSLGLLHSLQVDVLKIDRDFFVRDIRSKRTQIIISSIVRLARELSIETVSEGIETQEQIDILYELGCDVIQGYYFAQPMPEPEFRALLMQQV